MILGEPEEIQEPGEDTGNEAVARDEVTALKLALADARAKAELNLAGWQRAQADFANYKRRHEKELGECADQAKAGLILTLLPVMDDLERAFTTSFAEEPVAGWLEGFRLIERKLHAALEAVGLSPIKAMGEPFDPRFHEAVAQGEGPEGTVIGEAQKGYLFAGRVIRPSRVIVGSGQQAESSGSGTKILEFDPTEEDING